MKKNEWVSVSDKNSEQVVLRLYIYQKGICKSSINLPVVTASSITANGPTALPTSLPPWANASTKADKINNGT